MSSLHLTEKKFQEIERQKETVGGVDFYPLEIKSPVCVKYRGAKFVLLPKDLHGAGKEKAIVWALEQFERGKFKPFENIFDSEVKN